MTSRNSHNYKERQQAGYAEKQSRNDWSKNTLRTCGNWTEQLSSKGKVYYYNIVSEKSQWHKPVDWSLPELPISSLVESYRKTSDGVDSRKRSYDSQNSSTNFNDYDKRQRLEEERERRLSHHRYYKRNENSPRQSNYRDMLHSSANKEEDMDISAGSSPICNRSDISDETSRRHSTLIGGGCQFWGSQSHLLNSIHQSVKFLLSDNNSFLYSCLAPNGYKTTDKKMDIIKNDERWRSSSSESKKRHLDDCSLVSSWIHADLHKSLKCSVQNELKKGGYAGGGGGGENVNDQVELFLKRICSLSKVSSDTAASSTTNNVSNIHTDEQNCVSIKINKLFARLQQMATSHVNNTSRNNICNSNSTATPYDSPILDILSKGLVEIAQHKKPVPTVKAVSSPPLNGLSEAGGANPDHSNNKPVYCSTISSTANTASSSSQLLHSKNHPLEFQELNNKSLPLDASALLDMDFIKDLDYIVKSIPDHDESIKSALLSKSIGEYVDFDIVKKYHNPISEKYCRESQNDFLRSDKLLSQTYPELECEHKKLNALTFLPSVKADIQELKRQTMRKVIEYIENYEINLSLNI